MNLAFRRSTNTEDSDIDLFILANTPNEVLEMVASSKRAGKMQVLAKKPVEWAAAKKKEPIFFEEVERGIVLWEAKGGARWRKISGAKS